MRKSVLTICLTMALGLRGADVAVGPSATGSGSGADWSNIKAWSGTPSRGDTWYLQDGEYAGKTLSVAVSGTTGITIAKATESSHGPSTGWDSAYGDGQAEFTNGITFNTAYWTFTGTKRDGWTNGYGFKISGTTAGKAIYSNSSNLTVRYVEIAGHGPDDAGSPAEDGVYTVGPFSDHVYEYMWLHDQGRAPFVLYDIDPLTIQYVWAERNENHASQHSEGVSLYGGEMTSVVIANSIWVDIEGTAVLAVGNVIGAKFYNNLIYWTSAYPHSGQDGAYTGNGSISSFTVQSWTNCFANQNTVILPASGGTSFGIGNVPGSAGTGNQAYNNLYLSSGVIGSRVQYDDGCDHDYNGYWMPSAFFTESNGVTNLTTSVVSNFSGYDYSLASALPYGATLSSPFDFDIEGTARSVPFNLGAYTYTSPPVTGGAATAVTTTVGTLTQP